MSMKWFVTAATLLAALVSASPAFGLIPGSVKRPAKPPMAQKPSIPIDYLALAQFEELIGRSVTATEVGQIQRVSDQVLQLNGVTNPYAPKSVRWDLGQSGYEFTVLVCGQFKAQADQLIPAHIRATLAKLPTEFQTKVNGVLAKASGEIVPCFDPHTQTSYLMVGGAHTFGAPSLLTAGLSIGIYFNHKSEPVAIGQYMFGRFTWNIGALGKWELTGGGDLRCAENIPRMEFDFTKCRRFFISTGLGFDLGGAIFGKLKKLRSQAETSVAANGSSNFDLGAWSFSYGVIVKIHEFPWYERLSDGMGLKDVFSDVAQYTAQSK